MSDTLYTYIVKLQYVNYTKRWYWGLRRGFTWFLWFGLWLSLKDEAVGLMVGCFGMDWGLSLQVIWDNKALKARGWLSIGLDHSDLRDEQNGFIRHENVQCGLEVQGFASADLGERHCVGLWLQKDVQPAKMVAFRRVFDSFSLFTRSTFVALSFVFRLFLVRFSIGLR